MVGRRRGVGVLLGLSLLLASMGSGCALTGISRSDEVTIGRQTAAEIDRQYRTYEEAELTRIGERLAAVSRGPDFPYRFRVIEHEEINAFALPGGFIYVTSGLMELTRGHPEWLAAVLAHEIAHVSRRHIVKQMQRQAWLGLGIGILTSGTIYDLAVIAANIESLGYTRNQERDADTHGAVYLLRAGYDPAVMVEFLQQLQAAAGKSGGPGILRTHPNAPERMRRLLEQIRSGEIGRLAEGPGA